MPWPLTTDFSAMLQNPPLAFRDEALKGCQIEKDSVGQPRPRSGNFATVYRGFYANGSGAVALRVFNREGGDRRNRYEEIGKYLRGKKLKSLVEFDYIDRGIRSASDGKFYPLVTMEWVTGDTIIHWLKDQCLKNNRKAIAHIADLWIELLAELKEAQISHGDLQHGNVMVTENEELKLVDYDCMCVPSLVGRQNLEIGVDPYQHPSRNSETRLSMNLDDFSAIFILLVLRALAADPSLWNKYVNRTGYDKMLIRRQDFDAPETSTLFSELTHSSDPQVRELTNLLWETASGPFDKVPSLDTVLNPFVIVEEMLTNRNWDAAVKLLENTPPASDPPQSLQPLINEAFERVYCRKALDEAVRVGDEKEMIRVYNPKLLNDYRAARPSVEIAKIASQVIPVLKSLRTAHKENKREQFIKLWDENRDLLARRKSAEPYKKKAEKWRRASMAFRWVRSIMSETEIDVQQLASAWKQLVDAGGHPQAIDYQVRVDTLIRRDKVLVAIKKVPKMASEVHDKSVVDAWDESLLAGWDKAEELRPRHEAAKDRLEWLNWLRQLNTQHVGPCTLDGEQSFSAAASHLPATYQHELLERVQLAEKRIRSLQKLQDKINENQSDIAIAKAWQEVVTVAGQSLVPSELHARIDLSVERYPVLVELQKVSLSLPSDQLDEQLLAVWNEKLLADSPDAQPWLDAYQMATVRKSFLDQLQAAIDARNDMEIAKLAREDCFQDYPLPSSWQETIEIAQQRVNMILDLIATLEQDDRSAFYEVFNAELFRKYSEHLEAHQELLGGWMETEILPREKLGLNSAFRSNLVKLKKRNYRVRWSWPIPRFTDHCVLAICPTRPKPGETPEDITTYLKLPIDRRSWEMGSGSRVIETEKMWSGSYICVWAVVDLGYCVYYSEVLELGRLEGKQKK